MPVLAQSGDFQYLYLALRTLSSVAILKLTRVADERQPRYDSLEILYQLELRPNFTKQNRQIRCYEFLSKHILSDQDKFLIVGFNSGLIVITDYQRTRIVGYLNEEKAEKEQ